MSGGAFARICCSGRSPITGKSLVVSIYGAPPYVTVDPVRKKVGGIELDLVSGTGRCQTVFFDIL
jgi:hypothetical protein